MEQQETDEKVKHTGRNVFFAALVAVVCAVVVLGVYCLTLPAQGEYDPSLDYGPIYSQDKSESVEFSLAGATDETLLLFGSSELAVNTYMVPTFPATVFAGEEDGIDIRTVGVAYDQDLWHAIAVGAYAPDIPNKRIALIVSPGWFEDNGLEPGIFKMRFSYSLYRAFCQNPSISEETKSYIAARLREEGVDGALIDAGFGGNPVADINNAVFSFMSDMRLRQYLEQVRTRSRMRDDLPTATQDFADLYAQAAEMGAYWCTNNDYYVYDSYWTEQLEPRYDLLAGSKADETWSNEKEFADFACVLDICKECGLDPLIIIMPVNGYWYDYAGLLSDTRAVFYEKVSALCQEVGVSYLDLSSMEYEPYTMADIMHLGWKGWAVVDQAVALFMQGEHINGSVPVSAEESQE